VHKNSRFSGRLAHEGRSANVGRFSDTELGSLVERDGNIYTLRQYYLRYGNTSNLGCKTIKTQFLRSRHCGQPLQIDVNGYAFCVGCGKIFNSGKADDGDHAERQTISMELGPPPKRLLPKRWAPAGRVTDAAPFI
jgi:hypothetical protein